MAIEPVPYIDPAPVPGPQRGDESTFDDRMDAKIRWDETSAQQFGDLADNVVHNAEEALDYATTAGGHASDALAHAAAAQDSASASAASAVDSADAAGDSQGYAAASASSAADAANSALALVATSSSSLVVGAGTKIFTIPSGKQFINPMPVAAVSASAPASKLFGTVVSYVGTTLTVAVTDYEGSGTHADWTITPSGAHGPAGSISGGNLTGPLNALRGADVASATTPDIWATGGNYEAITGTASITGFTAAPQAGASRRVLAAGAFTITAGANLIIKGVPSGQSYVCSAGDELDIYAETTTRFRVTISRADGAAAAAMFGSFTSTRVIDVASSFIAQKTGWHKITLVGGGARGGVCTQAVAVGPARATGAGAPAIGWAMRFLIKGQSYTCLPGTGAPSISVAAGAVQAGADGGDTTFSGSGIATMTAGGGKAGAAASSAIVLSGGAGGVATGCDVNVTGGAGGDIVSTAAGRAATGAGACGIQGNTYKAGNVTPAATGTTTATGGAAPGGVSGDAANEGFSGGAGCGGPSPNKATSGSGAGGPNFAGVLASNGAPAATSYPGIMVLENATSGGSDGNSVVTQGSGGAAGAQLNPSSTPGSGCFSGWPGIVCVTNVAPNPFATVQVGSSTGGIIWNSSSAATYPGGANGRIYIEY
jgi:hypothetical protein